VLKKIGGKIGSGFLYGLGFSFAVVGVVTIGERIDWPNTNYSSTMDERKTDYLTSLIQSIESNGTDQCEDVVGTWVGEFIEEDGAYIRTWELNYDEGGRFWGSMIEKSITEEIEEKQEGTWSCSHSVLLTDVTVDGKKHKWNYLLLHNQDGERTYATLGSYGIENIYKAYRRK